MVYGIPNPSDYSNWIIKDQLIVGGYPYPKPEYRISHLDKLKEHGVNVFISLVEPLEISKYGDYQHLLAPGTIYHNVPIKDGSIADDKIIYDLVVNVYNWIKQGKLVYVHCWGGHGRAGTFVACFLQYGYKIDSKTALKYNTMFHNTRKHNSHKNSPQGVRQYAQIRRFNKIQLKYSTT